MDCLVERRSDNRIVVMQLESAEEDQNISRAQGLLQGEIRNVIAALRIATNLQDNAGRQHSKGLTGGLGARFAKEREEFHQCRRTRVQLFTAVCSGAEGCDRSQVCHTCGVSESAENFIIQR